MAQEIVDQFFSALESGRISDHLQTTVFLKCPACGGTVEFNHYNVPLKFGRFLRTHTVWEWQGENSNPWHRYLHEHKQQPQHYCNSCGVVVVLLMETTAIIARSLNDWAKNLVKERNRREKRKTSANTASRLTP